MNVLAGNETFDLIPATVQIVGFLFLILGNFTFNEIVEWKFAGLNTNLRKYRLVKKEINSNSKDSGKSIRTKKGALEKHQKKAEYEAEWD